MQHINIKNKYLILWNQFGRYPLFKCSFLFFIKFQVIDGNADTIPGREVTHFIDEPVVAIFIRFQVHTFVGLHPCMSVQVFGCAPGKNNP